MPPSQLQLIPPTPEEIHCLSKKHGLVGTILVGSSTIEAVEHDSRDGIHLHGNGFLTINGESTAPAQEAVPFIT